MTLHNFLAFVAFSKFSPLHDEYEPTVLKSYRLQEEYGVKGLTGEYELTVH